MKVLVSGGRGFIGWHVCDRLNDLGHEPVIFDRHRNETDYEQILGDVRDPVAVTEAVAHCEGVIHLAGVLGTQETIRNPRPAAETNVLGSLNVFEAVAQYELPAVYIAVGNHFEQNSYSITKTCAERMAFMYNRERGTQIGVVRAFNAYGPGQIPSAPYGPSKVRKIIPSFACRALAGDPVEVYGDGEQIMDCIHVRDVARILVGALLADLGSYDTPIEAGSGNPTTVNDIAGMVIQAAGQGEIVHVPLRPGETPGARVLADTTTIPRTVFDQRLESFKHLSVGIKETVNWYRDEWVS